MQTTIEKSILGKELRQFAAEIEKKYDNKKLKVIIFLDEEDVEIHKNQKQLQNEMQQSLRSGKSQLVI